MTRLYVSPAFSLSTSSDYCTIQNQAFNATRKNLARQDRPLSWRYLLQHFQPAGTWQTLDQGWRQWIRSRTSQICARPRNFGYCLSSGLLAAFLGGKNDRLCWRQRNSVRTYTDEKTKEHIITGFGQTSFFAAQMCANQYRDFAFSISLTDETARLLRWDRSGVIFSEAIHYRENPESLCRFLWRFGMPTYCSVVQTCLYTSASRKLRRRSFGIL